MARHYSWPACTVPGCGHVHTWASEAGANNAAERYRGIWVDAQGYAVCFCHVGEIPPTFPCDVTPR